MITPADVINYGRSTHIQKLKSWMTRLTESPKLKTKIKTIMAINARNFLIFMLVIINACRYYRFFQHILSPESDRKSLKLKIKFPP